MDSPFLREFTFTTNGIRGIANVDLTPYTCARMGQAIGEFLGAGASVILAIDYRVSGPMIKSALVSGLLSKGIHVHDAGEAPTPALQKYVKDTAAYAMGLIITASHNPPQFNGIKVVDSDGIEIPPEKERVIEQHYRDWHPALDLQAWNGIGELSRKEGIVDYYMDKVLGAVEIDKDRAKDFSIVVDPGNGITCCYIERFIKQLGAKCFTIFGEPDGCFPNRVSEPTPESLEALSRAVVEEGASFGVGFDGDGDRAIFVDDEGTFHWGDESFSVLLNELLKTYDGWIVTPVSSSVIVQDVVDAHGAKLEWTKVGSITVSRRMLELDAMIAGEENGGIFFKNHQPVRDGGIALALMLSVLSKNVGASLSDLFKALPKYYLHKETIPVENADKAKVFDYVLAATENENRLLLDGVKVFRDGGSVLIRPSGTEPKYRSFADGKTEEIATSLSKWGIQMVKDALEA
jgi:phosphomannomutase/phosphoglucomutase